MQRLEISEDALKKELQFHAIMLWSDAVNLELNLQVFSDLLISKDGRLGQSMRGPKDKQFVKFFLSNPDLIYADKHPVPRHGQGILIHCIQEQMKSIYGIDNLEYTMYGKPERLTFDYAESLFLAKAKAEEVQISNFYMIGDNPEGDIEGANRKGWTSILVRTGLFTGEQPNHPDHPASHVVQDMEEAVKLICRIENLKINI